MCKACCRSKSALDMSPGVTMGYLTEDKRNFAGAFGSLFRRGADSNPQQSRAAVQADVFMAVSKLCLESAIVNQ